MSIAGSSSIRRLKDVAVVLGLNELVPVGRRAPRGCDWWWLERFAKMGQDLPDRPWFRVPVRRHSFRRDRTAALRSGGRHQQR